MVHPCKQLGQLIVDFFSIHCCLASKESSHSRSASSRVLFFVLDVHASNSVVVVVQRRTSESAEMSWSYRWSVVPRPYRAGRLKALRYGIQAFSALCRMCLTLAHLSLSFSFSFCKISLVEDFSHVSVFFSRHGFLGRSSRRLDSARVVANRGKKNGPRPG